MTALIPEKRIHQVFEVGIILKGANAALEIVLGTILLFTMRIGEVILALIENYLIDDPNDFLATHFTQLAHYLQPQVQLYGALYLLSHGIVKIALVWGLLRNKLWAYPASLAVLALFILYQLIKIVQTHSIALILLTIFDFVIVWLIWHEYRLVSKHILVT